MGFVIFRFERSWICRNDRHSTISSFQCVEWVVICYRLHFRRDILGCAKTGSGKTLAFLIPALECLFKERWDQEDGIGVVIVSPIRELAIQVISCSYVYTQIFDVLCTIGKYHSFSAGLIIGGKDLEVLVYYTTNVKEEQKRILSMNILVATPGRLLQHIEQTPGFDCTNLRCLVIDEVDRCLDMGFKNTIDLIVESLGGDRQSQLYSATVSEKVKEIASSILTDPVYLNIDSDDDFATPKTIVTFCTLSDLQLQRYVLCELNQKIELLFSFIKSHLKAKTLVFASSRKEVRFLYEAFRRMKPGIPLLHIHGKQKQTMRTYTYYDFVRMCMTSHCSYKRNRLYCSAQMLLHVDQISLPLIGQSSLIVLKTLRVISIVLVVLVVSERKAMACYSYCLQKRRVSWISWLRRVFLSSVSL